MTDRRLHTTLHALFRFGVLLTLCIAPTQWSLEPRPKLHISPADLALAFTAGVWFLEALASREWRRLIRLPPWPSVLFVALACASATTAPDKAAALKDLVQYAEYFIVGAMIFDAFLRDRADAARQALTLLAVVSAAIVGLALFQYLSSSTPDLRVRGTFGNRNVLGGFLALALPLCFAGMLTLRSLACKAALGLLLGVGLAVDLAGASYFAIAAAIVGLAAVRGPRTFVPTVAALLVWQTFVLPRLPRENDLAHFRSVALYDGTGVAERRYPDWQAAYSMVLTHPWLGVGLGNYQKHVGQYYDSVPRQTGPSEPDIQNLYLVLAASAGLPALLAFLALLAVAVHASNSAPPHRTPLASGVAASLCAFALVAVWHPLLVRGIGLPLVFLLTLAHRAADPLPGEPTAEPRP